MTAALAVADAERRHTIARRLAEGHRVGDLMDEFGAERREVMDAGFAFQLRYVDSRDAFDVTARTHRTVLPPSQPTPTPVRHHPLIRPVVAPEAPVPDPQASAKRAGIDALYARIDALGVDSRTVRTWAHLRGIDCPRTGTLPARVVEAYEQWDRAGRPPMPMPEPPGPPEHPALESTTWDDLGDEETAALDVPEVEEPEQLLDEPDVDEAPAAARVVAIAVGSDPRLLAAIMTAATEAAEFSQVSVEDGWIYLEQAAS